MGGLRLQRAIGTDYTVMEAGVKYFSNSCLTKRLVCSHRCSIYYTELQYYYKYLVQLLIMNTAITVSTAKYNVGCTVYSVQRTAYSVQRTAYSVQRTVYSVQRTAYSVQRTAYSVQCTAYSVQRTAPLTTEYK